MKPTVSLRGVQIFKEYVAPKAQIALVAQIRHIAKAAPLFSPKMRSGKAMSVRMTSAGKYGWYSDQSGYRYEPHHPNGAAWPAIPPDILRIWRDLVSPLRDPDCCLINYYPENAKMGLHQDRDEADFNWPVLSISLGDDALFRVGNTERGGKTESLWLKSGDVALIGGAARLAYHGIDRLKFGTSSLLQDGGRINLTLRVVD
ncbi:MAG: alpha-ketoglutarate-dependent dioxygenase AlkB family protein [Paracoccaceae bacterium]